MVVASQMWQNAKSCCLSRAVFFGFFIPPHADKLPDCFVITNKDVFKGNDFPFKFDKIFKELVFNFYQVSVLFVVFDPPLLLKIVS